jgi:hypothetical protein
MESRNISTMRRKRQKRPRVVAAEVFLVCKVNLETASHSSTIPM